MSTDVIGTKGAAQTPATFTQEQMDAAKAASFAEGKAAGIIEGTKTGAASERTRIAAITSHAEAAGRSKLAAHLAHETEMTPEAAAAVLVASAKEAAEAGAPANVLAAKMEAEAANPKIGAGTSEAGEETAVDVGKRIAAHANASRKPLASVK